MNQLQELRFVHQGEELTDEDERDDRRRFAYEKKYVLADHGFSSKTKTTVGLTECDLLQYPPRGSFYSVM